MLKQLVFKIVPKLRKASQSIGLLQILDCYTQKNNFALYLRSLLSIGDCQDLIRIDSCRLRFSTMSYIENFIQSRDISIFEYGSGASTIWLAKRAKTIVSVEHDQQFYDLVKQESAGLKNLSLELIPAQLKQTGNYYFSNRSGFRHLSFERYVKSIDNNADLYDMILIDGRCREICLEFAIKHLKSDGLIVFDDAERYRKSILDLKGYKVKWVFGIAPASPFPGFTAFITKDILK